MAMPRLKWWQWSVGAVALIALAGAIFSPSDPATVAEGRSAPVTTDETITADYVEGAFGDASRLALQRGKRGAPLETITVMVKTTDPYGNEGTGPLLTLRWERADLARVNWDQIDRYQLLDLAAVAPDSPDAMLSFRDWCWKSGASGASLTPRLCRSGAIRDAQLAMSGG